jgi:hypothetical protein
MQIFPQSGELVWIGVRPARDEPMITVSEVMADQRSGLIGDRSTALAASYVNSVGTFIRTRVDYGQNYCS